MAASTNTATELDNLQLEFKQNIGHLPHTMRQVLNYCKQNQLPFKFRDIKTWWPNRSSPQEKPMQPTINSFCHASSNTNMNIREISNQQHIAYKYDVRHKSKANLMTTVKKSDTTDSPTIDIDHDDNEAATTAKLNDLQLDFKQNVGHLPHTMHQILNYCKQNNLPFKFRDIKGWWPNRSKSEPKPTQSAINAPDFWTDADDNKLKFCSLELVCYGYIRLNIEPLLQNATLIIPIDIINFIWRYCSSNRRKNIYLTGEERNIYFCINMDNEKIKLIVQQQGMTGSQRYCSESGDGHMMDVHLKYPSIISPYIKEDDTAFKVRWNGIFECGGHHGYWRGVYSSDVTVKIYKKDDTASSIYLYTKDLPNLPIAGMCGCVCDEQYGLIVACDGRIYDLDHSAVVKPLDKDLKDQRYFQLIEEDEELKWKEIENELKLKGNSAILMINNSDLFVCGHSGVGIYNFDTKIWTKLPNMRYTKPWSKPILCYDEFKQIIYCYINSSENLNVYCFDLDNNEWNLHSELMCYSYETDRNIKLMWFDSDGILSIFLCSAIVLDFDRYRKLWIVNDEKTKIFQQFHYDQERKYLFL